MQLLKKYKRLRGISRRWIFVLVAIAVLLVYVVERDVISYHYSPHVRFAVEEASEGSQLLPVAMEVLEAMPNRNVTFEAVVDVCKDEEVCVLLFILSARHYTEQRSMLRDTWLKDIPAKCVKYVFMLGSEGKGKPNVDVRREAETYGDIVVGAVEEVHESNVLKAILGYKYASTYCPQAKFVAKVDDDAFINIQRLYNFLGTKNLCQGHERCFIGRPVTRTFSMERRDPGSTVRVPEGRHDVRYMSGLVHVGSMGFVTAALETLASESLLYSEDVFFTYTLTKLVNAFLVLVDPQEIVHSVSSFEALWYNGQLGMEMEHMGVETRRELFLRFREKVKALNRLFGGA